MGRRTSGSGENRPASKPQDKYGGQSVLPAAPRPPSQPKPPAAPPR